jgi:hypothetical protein
MTSFQDVQIGMRKMEFRFNSDTKRIECDDPSVFVQYFFPQYGIGDEFLLELHGEQFGFRTADLRENDTSMLLANGLKLWRFDRACCEIVRWNGDTRQVITLVKEKKFSKKDKQDEALKVFESALSVFDGDLRPENPNSVKARVEYTGRLLAQLSRGKLVK